MNKTVIVKLMGGMGNQLFQYAAGRQIALNNRFDFKLDAHSGFRSDVSGREYSLGAFNVLENFATEDEVERFAPGSRMKSRLYRVVNRLKRMDRRSVIREGEMDRKADPSSMGFKNGIYLDGYWQDERFFGTIRGLLRREFTLKTGPDRENADLLKRIEGCESVGVHVRRTDYISNVNYKRIYATLDGRYYERALREIQKCVDHPELFVFSDDIGWAETNLEFPVRTVFIGHNGKDRFYEDFRLLCSCRHQIIANSSFSWWAAWLNGNPGKKVIAPSNWVNDSSYYRTQVPSSWATL